MPTTIHQMTIRAFHAAAEAMTMGALPDVIPMSPSDIRGWAGVVHQGEAVDGTHRAAALGGWAGEDEARLAMMIPVVVTDDAQLVRAILARKDSGRDDVDDLLEAALA